MDNANSGFVFLVILAAVGFRLLADRWDRDRIQQYVAERGGSVNDIAWQPFGRGWFGEKGDRIYEVEYTDRDGGSHSASCKTSLFSGVYFTEDDAMPRTRPTAVTGADREITSLESENQRLRAEIERLKDRGV